MPETTSPFDEPGEQAPVHPTLAPRERRPWWRWNILTLFAVLFSLVWVRYLLRLSPEAIWTVVFAVFIAWVAVPFFFVQSVWTTIAAAAPAREGFAKRERVGPPLVLLSSISRLAVALIAMSLVELVAYVLLLLNGDLFAQYRQFGISGATTWMQMFQFLNGPVLHLLLSVMIYLLVEVVRQLVIANRERNAL